MSINVHLKKSKKYFMVYKEELRWLFSSSYFLFLALIKHLNENLHLLFHFPSAPAPSSSKAAAARFRRRRGTCPPLGESSRLQKDRHSASTLILASETHFRSLLFRIIRQFIWGEWPRSRWGYSSTWKLMAVSSLETPPPPWNDSASFTFTSSSPRSPYKRFL